MDRELHHPPPAGTIHPSPQSGAKVAPVPHSRPSHLAGIDFGGHRGSVGRIGRMLHARRTIFVLCIALLGLGALAPALLYAAGKQPKKTDGQYRVTVAGAYRGNGTVEVKNKKVNINAKMRAEGEAEADFVCPNLALDGDHFEGSGTFKGLNFIVRGRLDGYDGDKTFRGARVLCTYTDGAGHSGRIVGVLE